MHTHSFKNLIGQIFLTFFALFSFYVLPVVAMAATDYQPLAPLPQTTNESGKADLGTYITGGFKLAIGIAGALAVVMIIIAGITYVSAESLGTKADARARIENSIIGLLLALGAYIILNTINPNLVNFDTNIDPIQMSVTPPVETLDLDATISKMADDSLQRINQVKLDVKAIKDQIEAIKNSPEGLESPENVAKLAELENQYKSVEIKEGGLELIKFNSELYLKKLVDAVPDSVKEGEQTITSIDSATKKRLENLDNIINAPNTPANIKALAEEAKVELDKKRNTAITNLKNFVEYRKKCPLDYVVVPTYSTSPVNQVRTAPCTAATKPALIL